MKFLTVIRAREDLGPPPPALMMAIGQLGMEAAAAGVLVTSGGLMPTKAASMARVSRGKLTVTDGPFPEAKEVIGGFAIYELPSREEAVRWMNRFMEIHRDLWPGYEGEAEIREVFEGPPPGM